MTDKDKVEMLKQFIRDEYSNSFYMLNISEKLATGKGSTAYLTRKSIRRASELLKL